MSIRTIPVTEETLGHAARSVMLSSLDNYYLKKDSDEEYCGSDINICYQNLSSEFASKAFGFDVCEYEDFINYTIKAAAEEINDFMISNVLKEFFLDSKVPLYVFESNGKTFFSEDVGDVLFVKIGTLDDLKSSSYYSNRDVSFISSLDVGNGTAGTMIRGLVFRLT